MLVGVLVERVGEVESVGVVVDKEIGVGVGVRSGCASGMKILVRSHAL